MGTKVDKVKTEEKSDLLQRLIKSICSIHRAMVVSFMHRSGHKQPDNFLFGHKLVTASLERLTSDGPLF